MSTKHNLDWAAAAESVSLDSRWLPEIFELVRFPSVSASEEHRGDVRAAAEWLKSYVEREGGQAEVLDLEPQPMVVARIAATAVDPKSAPTVLLYAHFDVQPAGDDSLWDSPPFEPEVRDGWIYGRGAADDKSHLYMMLRAALDLAAEGELPVNILLVSDGDEESEGGTVVEWLRANEEPVDFALCFDGMMRRPGENVFFISKRGLAFYEVEVEVGARDLHSGLFGGVALNSINVLMDMLQAVSPWPAELAEGSMEVTDRQIAEWDSGEDLLQVLRDAGGVPLSQKAIDDYIRNVCFLPSVEINGIAAGDAELDTTIIPTRARAHVSIRLAPGQSVDAICSKFEKLLRDAAHPDAQATILLKSANPGNFTDPDLPEVRLVRAAFAEVVGEPPALLPSGSSVPVMAGLDERGIPSVLTGFGLPDSAFHAPNERFPVAQLPLVYAAVRKSLVALAANGEHIAK